ncbi:MAG: phage minor head protein [Peptococcia bacterium]|jgi:hypothetical protein
MALKFNQAAARQRIAKKKKKIPQAGKVVLDQLNSFIEAGQAEPTFWLARIWEDQQNAITYKELREAILNGHMDEATLQAWQNDYATFVNETLKPLWLDSMNQAAANVAAKYPVYFFDPMEQGVRSWINTHGSEWVTLVSNEQREAINTLLHRSYSGDWSVDELSRAIRPTIGLNKMQSMATMNYYKHVKETLQKNNPTMKEATAAKYAREASHKYAGKLHRQRAYTIATTEMAFAYNKGADEGIRQAQEQGLMGMTRKVWSTAADERVCEICGALEGQTIDMDGDFNFKGKTLYSGQKRTPPAHPRCRCAVAYEEISPPQIPYDQQQAMTAPEPQPWSPTDSTAMTTIPEPDQPTIAEAYSMPGGLSHKGPANLGGTGEMHAYTDSTGQQWLFKPGQNKSGGVEPFRAYVQEGAYKVQNIIDPESAVEVSVGTVDGKFGAMQKRINTIDGQDLKAWQNTLDQLPEGMTQQLQRENVTDWLLANFDSHGGNFVVDDAGRLIGVDKEQAFKYIKNPSSKAMTYTFHPNASYGETEPIYNTMYRRFAKGEIDIDLQDTLAYIKRAEAIPDAQYREIFRDYAEGLYGKGKEAEALLDTILERKTTLRETYRTFYSELLTERTGTKQGFIWADEAAAHMQQPIAAVQISPSTLKQMNTTELKQLAKQKQIPYYNNMNKTQLVTSISDPVKAPQMSAQVRDRLTANEAARKAAATNIAQEAQAAKATDIFTDLAIVPENRIGIPVRSDGGDLEALNLTARRMNIGGTDYYEISGKLTYDTWSETWNRLKPIGTIDELTFEAADDALKMFSATTKADTGISIRSLQVSTPYGKFEMYIDGQTRRYDGWRGFFRARVETAGASGKVDADNMRQLMNSVGLDTLTANPTAADELILKKSRLVWQEAPQRMAELKGLTPAQKATKLDYIIKQERIDPARVNSMKLAKVFEGYSTYVDESVAKAYEKAGLRYVWSGVADAEDVVKIVKSPGLMSNNNRFIRGMQRTGASPEQDFRTGGSDSVFTRIGVTGTKATFDQSYLGSAYRIIIDPKEMLRTDWYAYTSDSYGKTAESLMAARPTPLDFIKDMKSSYRYGNEIMFRRGIAKESFMGISCQTSQRRAELLNLFKQEGVTKVNGIDIDKFVKVSTEIAKP